MIASGSIGEPGGQPFEDHHERAPVRFARGEKPQHQREIVYEVSAHSRPPPPPNRSGFPRSRHAAIVLHNGSAAVQVFADRFVVDRGDALRSRHGRACAADDRAGAAGRRAIALARLCDRLAALRHPLLVPLIDYGVVRDHWFEAHVPMPPMRASAGDSRRHALHLGRFLRAAGVELPADAVARPCPGSRSNRETSPTGRSGFISPIARRSTQVRLLFDCAGTPWHRVHSGARRTWRRSAHVRGAGGEGRASGWSVADRSAGCAQPPDRRRLPGSTSVRARLE